MELAGGDVQCLYGRYGVAMCLGREDDIARHKSAIEQDRRSAGFACFGAEAHADEAGPAQHSSERFVRLAAHRAGGAVELDRDVDPVAHWLSSPTTRAVRTLASSSR